MVGMVVTTSPICADGLRMVLFTAQDDNTVPLIYIEALSSQRCPVKRKSNGPENRYFRPYKSQDENPNLFR